jgi:hypothetical protein
MGREAEPSQLNLERPFLNVMIGEGSISWETKKTNVRPISYRSKMIIISQFHLNGSGYVQLNRATLDAVPLAQDLWTVSLAGPISSFEKPRAVHDRIQCVSLGSTF